MFVVGLGLGITYSLLLVRDICRPRAPGRDFCLCVIENMVCDLVSDEELTELFLFPL